MRSGAAARGGWSNGHIELRTSWWLVSALAGVALVASAAQMEGLDWGAVAIMTALGLGTGLFAFPLGRGAYVSFGKAVFVAALALFGIPVGICVVAATTAVLNGVCFRRKLAPALADVGAHILAAGAAGAMYALVGGRILPTSMTAADAGRCFVMFLTFGAALSLTRRLAIVTGQSLRSECARWIAGRGVFAEVAMLPLALLLVASYTPGEPATFPLLIVVLIVLSAAGKALWDAREAALRRADELRILNQTAQTLSGTRDVSEIAAAVGAHIADLVGSRSFALVLRDEGSEQAVSYAGSTDGSTPPARETRRATCLEAWVMNHGAALLAPDDSTSCPEAWGNDPGLRPLTGSWVGVPLGCGAKLLGVLSARSSSNGSFAVRDAELLNAFGNQVARAIDNARMSERLSESKAAVERWNVHLEDKVAERTREVERAKAELASLNRDLERRVEERTHELQSIQAKVLEAGRLAAVGELAAGIANELNNPLGGILGYTQYDLERLLSREGSGLSADEARDVGRHLRHVEREAQRCKRIVENLLRFSAGARCAFSNVDVNEILEQTVECTGRQLSMRGIELDLSLDRSLPSVVGDPQELQHVFANFILNARSSMAEGGTLRIRTSLDAGQDGEKQVAVRFEDSGGGIQPADVTRVFEPFFRASNAREGSGLGLSVSYGIVKQHGGDIDVESQVGAGSAFTVRLPMVSDESGC